MWPALQTPWILSSMHDDACSVHLLQTAMTRRAPEVPWSPSWSQLQQDADIRRSDLHLRLENSQLKGALSRELLQLSASLHGRPSSVSLQGIDFGEPLPLTLLVASILACIYILMYLKHLFVFFLRKRYIETSNRRWIHVKERERAPDFADCKRQMTERFCCNATHKTVVRLFLIVIAATACGSYMLREGFFDAVKDKLYLAMVILMILQVIIAMAWTYIENRLKPFWRLYEVIWRLQAAIKSGPSAVLQYLQSLRPHEANRLMTAVVILKQQQSCHQLNRMSLIAGRRLLPFCAGKWVYYTLAEAEHTKQRQQRTEENVTRLPRKVARA